MRKSPINLQESHSHVLRQVYERATFQGLGNNLKNGINPKLTVSKRIATSVIQPPEMSIEVGSSPVKSQDDNIASPTL